MVGATLTTEPPDITKEKRFGSSDLNAAQTTNRNRRSIPLWIDPDNKHGDVEYLVLQGINNSPLPRKPFVIGKSVELAAGGPIAGAISESRGTKYTLEVRNKTQVEKLLNLKKLIDDTEIEIIYHPTRNTCRCVITCWDSADTDIKEIEDNLNKQGVINVRRITRQTEKGIINTGTMILTVRGTVPPTYIKLGLLRIPTRQYYPTPLLCFKCLSYGHTKVRCPGEEKCHNCAEKHDTSDICNRPVNCNNCQGNHPSTSRSCPVYRKEAEIIRIKIDEGLSYSEAKVAHQTRVTASKGTYSQSVQQVNKESEFKEVAILKNLIKQKESEKNELMAENQKLRTELSLVQQTLNKVLKNQEKLQQQFKYQVQHSNESCSKESINNTQKSVTTQNDVRPRVLTRQQTKSRKQIGTPSFSCSDIETQNDRNKRPVSSPPKKNPKLHKTSESTIGETESDVEVNEQATQY